MCECVYCIWCGIAMLFTCALVLSYRGGKGGFGCEIWIVGANSKILGGPGQTNKIPVEESQQEVQSNPGMRPWRMYSQGASGRWAFKYVQSYDYAILPEENCHELPAICYPCFIMIFCVHTSRFYNTDWCLFFCRLKINYDSHKFILEFSTVANNSNQVLMLSLARAVDSAIEIVMKKLKHVGTRTEPSP